MSDERRMARFSICRQFIEDRPDLVMDLLSGVIIVRAELDFCSDSIEYTGLSELFPLTPRWGILPCIEVLITRDEDGHEQACFDIEVVR